jgi:hypothetical protein
MFSHPQVSRYADMAKRPIARGSIARSTMATTLLKWCVRKTANSADGERPSATLAMVEADSPTVMKAELGIKAI